jgi:hypothetical protein
MRNESGGDPIAWGDKRSPQDKYGYAYGLYQLNTRTESFRDFLALLPKKYHSQISNRYSDLVSGNVQIDDNERAALTALGGGDDIIALQTYVAEKHYVLPARRMSNNPEGVIYATDMLVQRGSKNVERKVSPRLKVPTGQASAADLFEAEMRGLSTWNNLSSLKNQAGAFLVAERRLRLINRLGVKLSPEQQRMTIDLISRFKRVKHAIKFPGISQESIGTRLAAMEKLIGQESSKTDLEDKYLRTIQKFVPVDAD